MNINSINGNNFAASPSATDTAKTSTSGGVGQDTFLKLLIAQMKNQDPTQPQDSAQYIAQLAQFTSLEKLTSINDRLGQLLNLGK